jgi:hypothetical protein
MLENMLITSSADFVGLRRIICQPRTWLLATLLIIGFFLRVWGIGFGLPYKYHIDEPGYVTFAWMLGHMHFASHPPIPTGFSYILVGEYGIFYMVTRLFGFYQSGKEFAMAQMANQTALYLMARLTSAFLGTATILVVWMIGRRAYDKTTGLLAATFLAFTFLHARNSHYAVPDVAVTFWLALALFFSVLTLQRGLLRDHVMAGFFVGIAIATKWSIAILLFPLLWAYIGATTTTWHNLRRAAITKANLAGMASVVLGVVVGDPQLLTDFEGFLMNGVFREYAAGQQGGFLGMEIDNVPGWIFYLKTLRWGMGDVLVLFSIIGFLFAMYRHSKEDILFLSFALPYYGLMGAMGHMFARYAIPLLVPLLLFAARLASATLARVAVIEWRWKALTVLFTIVAVSQPAYDTIRHDVLLTKTDTRTIAKEWIEKNIPPGSKIAEEWHTPELCDQFESALSPCYDVMVVAFLRDRPLEYYVGQGIDFLIASNFMYDIPLVDKQKDAARRQFYESLDAEAELVKEFRPYLGERKPPFVFEQLYGPVTSLSDFIRPGPVIKIYRLVR